MKNHNVAAVAMKPWKTLKDLLEHPKGKQEKEDITECVYKVPCANCGKTYVGETGRQLEVRLHEHKTEVESKTKRAFTRSQRSASLTKYSKSALTDHANQANHTIDWKKDYGHRQRTRPSYQVDQGSCTYPQERSSSWIETRAVISWFKPTIAFLVSWCDSWSSHEDSEELSTKFFWWRCRDEIEKSK